MEINLYDFDKTIYDGDSSTDFFVFSMVRYPSIALNLPKMLGAVIRYKFKKINKTEMKQVFFSFLKKVPDVDKLVNDFWSTHSSYIKDYYLKKDHSNDVIISASPEFLLEPITKELKVKKMIASKVDKKTGKFTGLNCHDYEKVKRLNKVYDDYIVKESYSDSLKSDLAILELAKKAYIVKGNKLILTNVKKAK